MHASVDKGSVIRMPKTRARDCQNNKVRLTNAQKNYSAEKRCMETFVRSVKIIRAVKKKKEEHPAAVASYGLHT